MFDLWKRNRFLAVLLFLSFALSFILVFYVCVLMEQMESIEEHKKEEEYTYEEIYYHSDADGDSVVNEEAFDDISIDGGILLFEGIYDYVGKANYTYDVIVVMAYEEDFAQSLASGTYPTDEMLASGNCYAVIGKGLSSLVNEEILTIGDTEVQVSGFFKPNDLEANDVRIYVYWDGISDELREDVLSSIRTSRYQFRWISNDSETMLEAAESVDEWINSAIDTTWSSGAMMDDDTGLFLLNLISMLNEKVAYILVAFSMVNSFALAWVMVRKRTFECVVRMACGMSKMQIYGIMLRQLLAHVVTACVATMCLILIAGFITGNGAMFMTVMVNRMPVIWGGMVIITLVSGMAPIPWILMLNPAQMLKRG